MPGDLVALVGRGFKAAPPASYSVFFDRVLVPTFRIVPLSDQQLIAVIPGGFHQGSVSVSLGVLVAKITAPFTAIASLSLSPAETTLAPGQTHRFTVAAHDARGIELPKPYVNWGMRNQRCLGNVCEDNDAAKVEDGLATAELDVGWFRSPGVRLLTPGQLVASGEIFVGNLNLMATGTILVRTP